MKPQEDIGSLIKTKLQSAKKASNEATWERIQHSLEERKRKRRNAFYIKLGSAGLLLIIGALFMFNYSDIITNSTTTSQEETHSKIDDQKIIEAEESKSSSLPSQTIKVSTNTDVNNLDASNLQNQEASKGSTTSIINDSIKETIFKTEISKENLHPLNVLKGSSKNAKALDTIVNRNDVPVTQTTQKVYYYYNSKNGQEMSSTNKKVIDSIVEINQKKRDSLKTKN